MSRDFTFRQYRELLLAFQANGYELLPFEALFDDKTPTRYVVLRHDVDSRAEQSLRKAEIESECGARSTYYFRIVRASNQPGIIRQVVDLGHEIGYHYEDLSLAKGDRELAIRMFCENLEYFRHYYPVRTICMHGSPASQWDNRWMWKEYSYRDFGVVGEPYLDTDFSQTLYITDTGRRWDGDRVSVRDKVRHPFQQLFRFRATVDIVKAVRERRLPSQIMLTTHPQRWDDAFLPWLRELWVQTLKNAVKRQLIALGHSAGGIDGL